MTKHQTAYYRNAYATFRAAYYTMNSNDTSVKHLLSLVSEDQHRNQPAAVSDSC